MPSPRATIRPRRQTIKTRRWVLVGGWVRSFQKAATGRRKRSQSDGTEWSGREVAVHGGLLLFLPERRQRVWTQGREAERTS